MKIKQNSLGVTEVFEIRLDVKLWKQITKLAELYQVSFSWIVRLCVLEFVEKQDVTPEKWIKSNNTVKQEYKNPLMKLHRHMLCLYGQDGLLLRLVSAQRGITISQLVRVALDLNLERLKKQDRLSETDLVQKGVKSNRLAASTTANVVDAFFHIKSLIFMPFLKTEYRRFMPFRHSRLTHCFSG